MYIYIYVYGQETCPVCSFLFMVPPQNIQVLMVKHDVYNQQWGWDQDVMGIFPSISIRIWLINEGLATTNGNIKMW